MKNVDFLLKNVDFIMKTVRRSAACRQCRVWLFAGVVSRQWPCGRADADVSGADADVSGVDGGLEERASGYGKPSYGWDEWDLYAWKLLGAGGGRLMRAGGCGASCGHGMHARLYPTWRSCFSPPWRARCRPAA